MPPPALLNPGDVLAAKLYHALLDHMTAQIGDPYFAARVGRAIALQQGHVAMGQSATSLQFDCICSHRPIVSHARRVAGGPSESIQGPTWSPDGRLYFISDRSGWWNLYRFEGQGIASLRTRRRGDQVMQVVIRTPTSMSRKQESLLKEFLKLEEKKLTRRLKTILRSGATKAAG